MLLTYLGRRLALAVVALFGVIVTAFLVAHSVPADPLATVLSRAGDQGPVDPRGLHQALGARPTAARAVRRLPDERPAGRSRRVLHHAASGPAGPQAVPARDGRALAGRPRRGGLLRRAARSVGGGASQPAGRSRRARGVPGRRRLADLLDRADRALRLLLPSRVGAGARAPGQPPDDAAARHRLPPVDSLAAGNSELFAAAVRAPRPARPRAGLVHHGTHRAHDAVVPARGSQRRLRAHRPVEGARRGPRRGLPRAAERPDPGGHRHRPDLRRACCPARC